MMNKVYMREDKWLELCDLVREKTGITDPMTADDVIAAIDSLGAGDTLLDSLKNNLTDYEIDDEDLTILRKYRFYENYGLEAISLPSITTIDNFAFYYCTKLDSVFAPNLLTIGQQAFDHAGHLGLALDTSTVSNIGSKAFNNSAFCGVDGLFDMCPGGSIGSSAFYACNNINTAKIRATTMQRQTFQSCTNLTKVWLSSGVDNIVASSATDAPFYGCTSLTDIYCETSARKSGWGNYWNYKSTSGTLTVHYGVSETQFDQLL